MFIYAKKLQSLLSVLIGHRFIGTTALKRQFITSTPCIYDSQSCCSSSSVLSFCLTYHTGDITIFKQCWLLYFMSSTKPSYHIIIYQGENVKSFLQQFSFETSQLETLKSQPQRVFYQTWASGGLIRWLGTSALFIWKWDSYCLPVFLWMFQERNNLEK